MEAARTSGYLLSAGWKVVGDKLLQAAVVLWLQKTGKIFTLSIGIVGLNPA